MMRFRLSTMQHPEGFVGSFDRREERTVVAMK